MKGFNEVQERWVTAYMSKNMDKGEKPTKGIGGAYFERFGERLPTRSLTAVHKKMGTKPVWDRKKTAKKKGRYSRAGNREAAKIAQKYLDKGHELPDDLLQALGIKSSVEEFVEVFKTKIYPLLRGGEKAVVWTKDNNLHAVKMSTYEQRVSAAVKARAAKAAKSRNGAH